MVGQQEGNWPVKNAAQEFPKVAFEGFWERGSGSQRNNE